MTNKDNFIAGFCVAIGAMAGLVCMVGFLFILVMFAIETFNLITS